MATIIVFASSLTIATLLIITKAIELRFGKRNFFLNLLAKSESASVRFVNALKFRCLQIIQTIRYIILVQSKEYFTELLRSAADKIISEYQTRQSAIIMGRKELINNGSVSFYLKKITEHKGNALKGKIEESM